MNRSSFFKKLGIGLGVAVVAPQVFAEKDNFTEPIGKWTVRYIDPPEFTIDFSNGEYCIGDIIQHNDTGMQAQVVVSSISEDMYAIIPLKAEDGISSYFYCNSKDLKDWTRIKAYPLNS